MGLESTISKVLSLLLECKISFLISYMDGISSCIISEHKYSPMNLAKLANQSSQLTRLAIVAGVFFLAIARVSVEAAIACGTILTGETETGVYFAFAVRSGVSRRANALVVTVAIHAGCLVLAGI